MPPSAYRRAIHSIEPPVSGQRFGRFAIVSLMEKEKIVRPRIVAFDFDGVIASYSGFIHEEDVQDPIPGVLQAIRSLKQKDYKILIHSTRSNAFLHSYCKKFSIPFDYINHRLDLYGGNPGKPIAFVYVDDRNICYKGQTAEELESEIVNFKAYWQK